MVIRLPGVLQIQAIGDKRGIHLCRPDNAKGIPENGPSWRFHSCKRTEEKRLKTRIMRMNLGSAYEFFSAKMNYLLLIRYSTLGSKNMSGNCTDFYFYQINSWMNSKLPIKSGQATAERIWNSVLFARPNPGI